MGQEGGMTEPDRVLKIALIGFGAIGRQVAEGLGTPGSRGILCAVVVRPEQVVRARAALPHSMAVYSDPEELAAENVDLVVECAGQGAVRQHAEAVLRLGIDLMLISTGALVDAVLRHRLTEIAARSGARILLPAGAIAGLDGLGALQRSGLHRVSYISTKPPHAWKGTPAEDLVELDALTEPAVLFKGPAHMAATLFPKNANLAATVALSGLGFEDTEVTLVADPRTQENTGHIKASGRLGTLTVELRGCATADNPKTSSVTAFSILRAIDNEANVVVI
jgi:aspartate dehydrogenase